MRVQEVCAIVLVLLSGASASIVFTVGPADMQANDGEIIICPCEYTGTNDLPFWRINDTSYTPTNLPYGYYTIETGLVFTAFPYLNNTLFQCYFVRYNPVTGETHEIRSDTGMVTVFVGENSTSPEAPLEVCKPSITAITVSSPASEIYFTWVENAELHCKNYSYTAQLTTCDHNSTEFTEACTIASDTTFLVVNTNMDCPGMNFSKSLAFRVKSDGCQDPRDFNCYTSYYYWDTVSDTDTVPALMGTGFVYENISSGVCDTSVYVCVKTTETPGFCTEKPEVLAERLPGGYTLVNAGRDLHINDVLQSLNGTVHTISCPRPLSCSKMGAVDRVTNNFLLKVTQDENIVECSLDALGSINSTVEEICTRKEFFGGRRVANGMVCYTENFNGSNATYFCDDGYHVEGSNTETCEASGEWSDNKTCTDVPEPSCSNAHISRSGSTAHVTCEEWNGDSYDIQYMDEVDTWEDCSSCNGDVWQWIGIAAGVLLLVIVCAIIIVCCVCLCRKNRKGQVDINGEDKKDSDNTA